jgi:hypothetical protein
LATKPAHRALTLPILVLAAHPLAAVLPEVLLAVLLAAAVLFSRHSRADNKVRSPALPARVIKLHP